MLGTPSLNFFGTISSALPNTLSPVILWVIFAVVCIVWSVLAGILVYHWNAYDAHSKRLIRVRRIFFIGSFVILSLAASFIFSL